MSANIASQMTQEEVLDYLDKVLQRAGLGGQGSRLAVQREADAQELACTTQIICTVVSACGRPIAKAEQECIRKAEAQFEAAQKDSRVPVAPGVVPLNQRQAEDSPFRDPQPAI